MVHPKLLPIPIGICAFEYFHLCSCVPALSRYNEARPWGRQRRPGALGGSSQKRGGEGGGQGEEADDVCQHQPQEQGPWLGQDEVIWMKEKSFTELELRILFCLFWCEKHTHKKEKRLCIFCCKTKCFHKFKTPCSSPGLQHSPHSKMLPLQLMLVFSTIILQASVSLTR